LDSTDGPGRPPVTPFQEELAQVWQDPGIWKLALRRAGNRDLAEDALQETFYAVARVRDPGHIENLRAFFCTALIHQIHHLRGQLGPIVPEDPATLAGARQQAIPLWSPSVPRSIDEAAVDHVLADMWLRRFRSARQQLWAVVPERSSDPGRYRDVIVAAAEEILHAAWDGNVSWADSNMDLRAAYPEWLDEPGCSQNTCHQRLSRARREVQALLMAIVSREELSP
jgi:DNA-directed RNA polymerase specialized sigma24 family protein